MRRSVKVAREAHNLEEAVQFRPTLIRRYFMDKFLIVVGSIIGAVLIVLVGLGTLYGTVLYEENWNGKRFTFATLKPAMTPEEFVDITPASDLISLMEDAGMEAFDKKGERCALGIKKKEILAFNN